MLVKIDYPAVEAERDIRNLVETRPLMSPIKWPADLFSARQEVLAMHMARVEDTSSNWLWRPETGLYGDDLAWLEYGASRGTISLDRCARAHSWIRP